MVAITLQAGSVAAIQSILLGMPGFSVVLCMRADALAAITAEPRPEFLVPITKVEVEHETNPVMGLHKEHGPVFGWSQMLS